MLPLSPVDSTFLTAKTRQTPMPSSSSSVARGSARSPRMSPARRDPAASRPMAERGTTSPLAFALALALVACSESGGAGTGNGGAGACDQVDFAAYAGGEPVSLERDLMPTFGLQCANSQCHGTPKLAAGLNLGPRCKYDAEARGKCVFPEEPGPMPDDAQPLSRATIDAVWAALTEPAATVNGGKVLRVEPGHPERSFLIQKLAGTQNDQGHECTNQEPAFSPPEMTCGSAMPLSAGDPLCTGTQRARFDAIARWIAQGAKNN